MQQPDQSKSRLQISLPINWTIPDSIRTDHATHLVVQQQGTEFIFYFFEAEAPFIVGTVEEQAEIYKNLKEVKAKCVSKIVMSAENAGQAANGLIDSLNKFNTLMMTVKGEENADTPEETELSHSS
jgi:pentose-5-phosphate-3-epimerase